MSFQESVQYVFGWEGGYGNDPRDPGGATNKGIIQVEYDADRRKRRLPLQSVRYITTAEAEAIYKAQYWDATHCDSLNPGLADALFDADVNSGDRRGVVWLQEAINDVTEHVFVKVDGVIGPITISAANQLDPVKLIDALMSVRLSFMKSARNPKTGASLWAAFGAGWSDRIIGVRKQAHALAKVPPLSAAPLSLLSDVPVSVTPAPGKVFASSLPDLSSKATLPSEPKEIPVSFFSSIFSFFLGLLNSTQLQSVGRTIAKVGGTLLVAKYGIDPTNLASVVGGIVAAGGVLSSIKAHAAAPVAVPSVSSSDVIKAAVQSAVESATASILAGLSPAAQATPANPSA